MVGAVTESVWWLYSLVLQELTLRAVFIYGTILLVSWLASKLFIFPLLSPLRKVWIFFLSSFVVFHGCPFSFQVDVCMSVLLHAVWLFVFWKLYHQEMWKIMSTLSKQFFFLKIPGRPVSFSGVLLGQLPEILRKEAIDPYYEWVYGTCDAYLCTIDFPS